MSNILWKNFHLCFLNLKRLPPPQPSKHHPHHRPPPPDDHASATAPTSALIKNSNRLHDTTSPENSTTSSNFTPHSADDSFFTSSSEDSDFAVAACPPELASVYASQRFFFSSPGISNSIIDSPDSVPPPSRTSPVESSTTPVAGTGGFTVQKYSSDLYGDFRRSMQEMIEARDVKDLNNGSWEYLQELLLCYLALNPKQTHKFIVGAFTDTVAHLMSPPPPQTPWPAVAAGKPRKLGGRRQGAANRSRTASV